MQTNTSFYETAQRSLELSAATQKIREFCDKNSVKQPRIEAVKTRLLPKTLSRDLMGLYVYNTQKIKVYADNCLITGDSRLDLSKTWSFPGYKTDLSLYGVLAHEVGHHLDNLLRLRDVWRAHIASYDKMLNEQPVSAYACTSVYEDIAESIRLLITNPDLLRILRPMRHTILTVELDLQIIEPRSWREVLERSKTHVEFIEGALNTGTEIGPFDTECHFNWLRV